MYTCTHAHEIGFRTKWRKRRECGEKKIVASLPRMCKINNILIVRISLCAYNNWMSRKKNLLILIFLPKILTSHAFLLYHSASTLAIQHAHIHRYMCIYTDLTYTRLHNDLQRAANRVESEREIHSRKQSTCTANNNNNTNK